MSELKEIPYDTKKRIEYLKKSPLFNLSLSSMELFHSNFLYWIGYTYPSEFGEIFAGFLKKRPEDTSIKEIYREKENIDLSFSYLNGEELLIENKVKSIPYIEQLEKYSKKHNNFKSYILLSLSEPIFFKSRESIEISGVMWSYLSYSALNIMLKSITEKIDNEYHKGIINDYCAFVDGLVAINECCAIDDDELFDFHSIKSNPLYVELINIRLHDFYLKKKYELIAHEVFKRLKDKGKNLTGFNQPLNWENETPIIFMGSGMTRSLGLMDLKYLISKNVILGIQIQGEHYRMVVEDRDGKTAKDIKYELANDLWFDLAKTFPNSRVYPKAEKGFNKYGTSFFYKSVKLGTKMKIKDVINIILDDVQKIETKYDKTLKVIMQANTN